MGSYITLDFGSLQIDWGKNDIYNFHGQLFQNADLKKYRHGFPDGSSEVRECFSRTLTDVLPRLDLLGFTLDKIREVYYKVDASGDQPLKVKNYSFDELLSLISGMDVSSADETIKANNEEIISSLGPYIALRLFSVNPLNLDKLVVWNFFEVVENGWVQRRDIILPLQEEHQFLIVTEGKTDILIIKKALDILRPKISDFLNSLIWRMVIRLLELVICTIFVMGL